MHCWPWKLNAFAPFNPDDQKLRSMTRQIVSALEHMWRNPGVSLETYTWACHLLAKFADAEHGTLLRPSRSGQLPESVRQPFEQQLKKAESDARNDPLTGLANRRRLAELLKNMAQYKTGRDIASGH